VDDAPAEHDEADPTEPHVPETEPSGLTPTPDAAAPGRSEYRAQAAGRRVPPLLWAVVALLAAVALVTSLLAARATAERDRDRRDRRAVEEVAGRLATALSTYDYRDFDATKRRVLALSTGAFASEYGKAVEALASLIDQTKATSEATADDVFVGNLDAGRASAIVVLKIQATGVGGPRLSVDNYVDLSLVKVNGDWRVDGVKNLNLGVAGDGGASPPTTAAAPPASVPKPSP
jgi:hypothetical protein